MSATSTIPPVRCQVTVACAVEHAFSVFTDQLGDWWPLGTHAIDTSRARTAALEGRVGGRIFERWDDGSEHEWGTITAWEPPSRLVYDWRPNHERTEPTEVEMRFTPTDAGTLVEIEHRGWERLGTDGAEARDSYEGGWPGVLALYAAATTG